MEAAEFRLRQYRFPVQWFTILFLFAILLVIPFGVLISQLALPVPLAAVLAGLFASAVIGWAVYKDNRLHPAGVLRLTPGKLEYTADVTGPIAFAPDSVRDMVEVSGRFIVRQKKGPSLVIHPVRLEVPLSQLRSALATWMLATNQGVEFVHQTDTAQKKENLRVKIMVWAGALAIVCRLLVALFKN
jgi:hypothetical protein